MRNIWDNVILVLLALITSFTLTELVLQGADSFDVFSGGAFSFILGGLVGLKVAERKMGK